MKTENETTSTPTTEASVEGTQPAWAQFQKDTAGLFELAGYDVEQNVLLGHKKVDIRISERRLGKVHRTAVECKYWKRAVKQSELSVIYANYLPLIPKYVDEILVLTDAGVADSASTMVALSPNLRQLSYSELLSNLFDFRHYLKRLVDQYYEDGLDRYYVHSDTTDGESLGGVVEKWIDDPTGRPLAILGSYGMGKTTFARHLAHKHAHMALEDVSHRIPVFVRLGEIANEQSLEGLLGKVFTTSSFVRNYNFSTFLELNRMGRFIIIFDGFDEMKQTLSWEEFRYNLKELNRLVVGRSKVIILGRPTAFLNDEEYNFALHGIRKAPIGERKDPDWPDYIEHTIEPFSEGQIGAFLSEYVKYLVATTESATQRAALSGYINYDARVLLGDRIGDIARRPVQLKMIAEILPDYHGQINELTVHTLYDYFIDYVIERESFKTARKRFSTPQRRTFARDVAWWLWRSRERSASEQTIPGPIVEKFRTPDEALESVVRDLVSASLLDRRLGGRLFFPHRSFQEFLVAEAIVVGVKERAFELTEVSAALTPQVTEFLEGFSDEKFIVALCALIKNFRGSLPFSFLKMVSRRAGNTAYFPEGSQWGLLLKAIAVASDILPEHSFMDQMKRDFARDDSAITLAGLLFSSLVACGKWRDGKAKQPARMLGFAVDRIREVILAQRRAAMGKKKVSTSVSADLVDLIRALNFSKQEVVIVTGVYRLLRQQLRYQCYVADWDVDSLDYARAGLPERISEWGENARSDIQELLESVDEGTPSTRPNHKHRYNWEIERRMKRSRNRQ